MNKYFIPTVVDVNGIQVPSIPFQAKDGKHLFLGDVIEILLDDDGEISKDINLVDLNEGVYVVVNKDKSISTPMYMLVTENITLIGNSNEDEELLNLLTL